MALLLMTGGLVGASPIAAAPIERDELRLAYNGWDYRITNPLGYWWQRQPAGEWSVERGRQRADGSVVLDVRISPPDISLPLDPGPATLFYGLELYGDAGGDMGAGSLVGRPGHVRAQPCRPSAACDYRARVTIPTDALERAAARSPHAISWHSVDVTFVLVRTFAQGNWAQVLPFGSRGRTGRTGTVARPGAFSAPLVHRGLFTAQQGTRWLREWRGSPIVPTLAIAERDRKRSTDTSAVPATVPVRVDVDAGDCRGWSLMNEQGDVAFDETDRLLGRQVMTLEVPAGTSWYVRSPSLANIDVPADTIHSFGPFEADGDGIGLSGAWACLPVGGSVEAETIGAETAADIETALRCDDPSAVTTSASGFAGSLEGDWSAVAAAPIAGRTGHTATWTGDEVLVWGGLETGDDGQPVAAADGAAYDPATDTWRRMSAAPIKGRQAHSAVWTGSELIVWGGRDGDALFRDGAIYDPATDTWQGIEKLRKGAERHSHQAAWTGSEMLIWSGVGKTDDRRWRDGDFEALGYAPATGSWAERRPPIMGKHATDDVVWTDGRLFAVGYGDRTRALMAVYDPVRDEWSGLPRVDLAGRSGARPLWTGEEVLFLAPAQEPPTAGLPVSAVYRPAESCWRTPAAPPAGGEISLAPVWGDGLAVFAGPRGIAYEPEADRWLTLPPEPGPTRTDAPVVWAGDRLFAWGGRNDADETLGDGMTFRPRA